MRFSGFGPRTLPFFKALAFHQDKAWFEENRAIYDGEIKAPMEALLVDLSAAFVEAGLPIRGERRSIFRLHRDTRFAKDKRPYKTNIGAILSRDATKRSQGFVYLHLDPEGCFAAAGFWHPEPAEALVLRHAIVDRPDRFRAVLAQLGAERLTLDEGEPLSRLPKGFEGVREPDLAVAVRCRNLTVRRPIPDRALGSAALTADLVAFASAVEPLLRFGWSALDSVPPDER